MNDLIKGIIEEKFASKAQQRYFYAQAGKGGKKGKKDDDIKGSTQHNLRGQGEDLRASEQEPRDNLDDVERLR